MTTTTAEDPVITAVLKQRSGAERPMLEAYLDYFREAMRRKVLGVSDEDARRRLVPSLTTLSSLIKHMTSVERHWFYELMGPEGPPGPRGDDTFVLDPQDTVESLIAEYDRVCAQSRELSSEYTLADSLNHAELGDISLRWIYVHMIEETARHAGHADILRELTDGKTGGLL